MLIFILSTLTLLGLGGIAYGIRAVSADLRGMDGTAAAKTTEERKNEKIRQEIEKWRESK